MSWSGRVSVIRALLVAAIAAVSVLAIAGPSSADVAVIEATVPLHDSSEAGIAAAVHSALDSALREAVARGFQWIQPLNAFLGANYVGVQVLAATDPLEDEGVEDDPGQRMPVARTTYDL